jgi:hypothetical protein
VNVSFLYGILNLIEDKSIHHVLYQNDEDFSRVLGKFLDSKLNKLFAPVFAVLSPWGGLTKNYQGF